MDDSHEERQALIAAFNALIARAKDLIDLVPPPKSFQFKRDVEQFEKRLEKRIEQCATAGLGYLQFHYQLEKGRLDRDEERIQQERPAGEITVAPSAAPVIIRHSQALQKNLDEVRRLSEEGLTVRVIAQRIGISESTVKRYRKELGIKKRKG